MPFADVAALAQTPPAVVIPVTAGPWKTITVRPGDTVWQLAITHHTTVPALVEKNRLARSGSVIHPGQKLLVPGAPQSTPTSTANKPAPGKPTPRTAASPPAQRPAPTPGPTTTHLVRAGETMTSIAARHGVSLTKLLAANRLRNASLIYVGQRIRVPVAPPAPARQAPTAPKTAPAGYTVPEKYAAAVKASKARLAHVDVPSRAETAALIRAAATRHGVDPRLALAVGWLESGWYQRTVSYTDAVGVMQIMPTSATWAAQLVGRPLDRYTTRDNVTSGVVILRALLATADSRDEAIAGYYQGLRSVRTRGMYDDTKRYVATVKAISDRM